MTSQELSKAYEPKKAEERWYAYWSNLGLFHGDPSREGEPYCIVIPPPNVTGSLHMGHALNVTLQDTLVRYHRMLGRAALWLPGMDHAGIATQNVVERLLKAEGKGRHDLGRAAFVERVWEWKRESGGAILNQLKRLGAACDWERERFTMDEGLSLAVREAFVRLHRKGLIYRGKYIINWCPRCQTALADLEVDHKEKQGALWHVRYPAMDGGPGVVVATTRPETMLGDTAVAVHPEDGRFASLVGSTLRLPLMNRPIPVVADAMVDREFGTGAVKITPAHDPNDFEVGKRHGLPSVKVIDAAGKMTADAGEFAGLDRFAARAAVLDALRAQGLLVSEEPHLHSVGHCYRCSTVVEPWESLQWFVRTKPLADAAVAAVRSGETRIVPAQWEANYFEWMENIRDWCISRQIWWGHRIPAWHCADCGAVFVETEEPERCSCGSEALSQDEDVLDTWFSSALWPFSTLGWPAATEDLAKWYPTSALVTGYDILFFWVARMMMMGIEFTGKAPFRDVVIHALVYDDKGEKMSKTRGNVIDPLEMIDRYGTDAFRFTLLANNIQPLQGIGIRMGKDSPEKYKELMNKIHNAGRFVLFHVDEETPRALPEELSLADRWILSRLQEVTDEIRTAVEEYRFKDGAMSYMHFLWDEFCDWYVEMAKPALGREDDPGARGGRRAVLLHVFESILKLGHPFIPFLTEELWQALPGERRSIYEQRYPEADSSLGDVDSERETLLLMAAIRAVRNVRSELNVPPSRRVEVRLKGDRDATGVIRENEEIFSFLARAEKVEYMDDDYIPVEDATAVVDGLEVCLPLKGLIDFAKEAERLRKEIGKAEGELASVAGQLSNEHFVTKAPPGKVDALRARHADLEEKAAKLARNLELVGKYL
jgi:valyl-tRNA synthetase